MEGLSEIPVEDEVQRSNRVSSADTNNTGSALQPAETNGSTSAHGDGRLALKPTTSRFADEEDAHTNAQGGKTIVSFSQGDPANPYNWSTV